MVKKDVERDIISKETEIIDTRVSALNSHRSSAEWKDTLYIAINSTIKITSYNYDFRIGVT